MKNQLALIYKVRNVSSMHSTYIPDTDLLCVEYLLKSLDLLLDGIVTSITEWKSFPRFLILKDHVACNIVFDGQHFFINQLEKKLADLGLIGMGVKRVFTISGEYSVFEKIKEEDPGYQFDQFLKLIQSRSHYLASNDGTGKYLVYELTIDKKAEERYLFGEEGELPEEKDDGTQSPNWEYYYRELKRYPNQPIDWLKTPREFPGNHQGRKYELILESGELIKAEMGYDLSWGSNILGWKKLEGEKRISLSMFPIVLAWKLISELE